MYCAECGQPLSPFGDDGAHRRCCHGYGYWASLSPMCLPEDILHPDRVIVLVGPKRGKKWFRPAYGQGL